jgi:hypothetical protein
MSDRATRYRKRHPDRVKEAQRRWRERNRERRREYSREYKRRTQKDYRQRRKVALWNSIIGVYERDETTDICRDT